MFKGTVESYKLVEYLEKKQINEILEKARLSNKRDYLIMLTLWRTGIRAMELVSLKKKDVRKDELIVRRGKGNKARMIPIDSHLYDLLSYYSDGLTKEDLLFPLTTASVRNITHKYQGSLNVHPHTFRHSYAIFALKSGVNIRALQKILGHSDLNTTAVYLNIVGQDIKDEHKKMNFDVVC